MDTRTDDIPVEQPFRAYDLVWFALGAVEILFFSRFLLHLVGAAPGRWIPAHVNTWTLPLIRPFLDVFPGTRALGTPTVEWASLLAMLVYPIVAAGIVALFRPRATHHFETTRKVVTEQ